MATRKRKATANLDLQVALPGEDVREAACGPRIRTRIEGDPPPPPPINFEGSHFSNRPADRILRDGSARLSDAEVLALVLPKHEGSEAGDRAQQLLRSAGGLDELIGAQDLLLTTPGTDPADVAALLAIRELATRPQRREVYQRSVLDRPDLVASYLGLRYSIPDQEVMGALFLDCRSQILGERELFRGTLCRMAVEPRQMLRPLALQFNAHSIILFHTHPTGEPKPSLEDIAFTDRVKEACANFGIRLADHIILGSQGQWVSLQRRRPW